MPNSSDSDEFYDAEEDVKCEGSRKNRKASRDNLTKRSNSVPNVSTADTIEEEKVDQKIPAETVSDSVFVEPSKIRPIGGRKRFQEIREKLQNEDEDWVASNITPPNSQNSSIEGVYVGTSKKTPFRVVEPDTVSLQSINSLGRVGRIFNNVPEPPTNFPVHPDKTRKAISVSALSLSSQESTSTPSSNSKDTSLFPSTTTLSPDQLVTDKKDSKNEIPAILPLQEPDVIASTKASSIQKSYAPFNHSPLKEAPPVAPPRRKKKNLTHSKSSSISSATFETCDLASPVSTIESLTKEFENCLERPPSIKSIKSDKVRGSDNDSKSSTLKSGHSLDIRQAIKGQFVVKPQDIDNLKAESSSSYVDSGNIGIDLQGINTLQVGPEPTSPRISQGRGSVGHYSLGPHRGTNKTPTQSSKERRKSAGDESLLRASALRVRTHTDSGKHLSDYEILEQITVLNLDTGEKMPLSLAEDKLPQCINPLSLHIMRLTSEYVSSNSMDKEKESDEESVDTKKSEACSEEFTDNAMGKVRKKTAKFKRFVDTTVKKTMNKARTIAQEVTHARHKEDTIDIVDMVNPGEHNIKLKTSSSHKGPYEFEKVEHVQEIKDEHEGPIWCMKFSGCGRLLATAGQDKILRIWIVRDAFTFFQEMRTKYNAEKASPTPSQESLVSHHSTDTSNMSIFESMANKDNKKLVFMPKPFCTYSGHTSDLLDVSWSKNYFILSSSMDKTVRLWHISRKECLCCFQHIDFVTAIAFHPRDDRYFLSGSLDGKLRLWNIPDKKVAVWSEVDGSTKLITAANFCLNGIFAVIGTYDGRCIFYNTDQLKYHTTINVRSTRGRNATGRKICGIEPMPGEDKVLVTSNDSRIRLYNLKDLNVSCKYKGYVNMSSHIKGSFSHDGKYIVSGSENRDIYIWKTYHDYAKFSSVRRDRNDFWEAIKAHNAVVTCAIFAPNSEGIIKMVEEQTKGDDMDDNNRVEDPIVEQHTKSYSGYVLVSADFNGCIKVFINKMKPKHSSLPVSAMS